ncbi:MAG: DUF927 domain-containing protein, partial [Ghiorsea sp.]
MSDIREQMQGQWDVALPRLDVDSSLLDGKHHPSPVNGGVDGFRFIDKNGDGYYVNNQEFGDGFDLLKLLYGWGFKRACQEIRCAMGWSDSNYKPPTEQEKAEIKAKHEKLTAEREAALKEQYRIAAKACLAMWEGASIANNSHPYLTAKGVLNFGLRQYGKNLVMPMYINGEISSHELITPDGKKTYANGSKKKGAAFSIAGEDLSKLDCFYIGEGFSTCASVRMAVKGHTLVAGDSNNLKPVAEEIRRKYPKAKIIILADNDQKKEVNSGLEAAIAAAQAVDGLVALPAGKKGFNVDFNDMHAEKGLEVVAAGIANAVSPEMLSIVKVADSDPVLIKGKVENSKTVATPDKSASIIPMGYSCGTGGVFIEHDNKDAERLTHRPVWVEALSRDSSRDNWGRLVCWVDHDGNKHERAIAAAIFHANGNELSQELATTGLPIVPAKERALLQYLSAFTPEARLTAATSTGWHKESFVLPDRVINPPKNERLIYQSSEYKDTGWMKQKGTLKDWQDMVKDVSPLVMFAIAASLAAPVRYLTNTAAGGFHFFGRTSHGKTTLLQAAASVWGNATDPAMGGGADAYIQRWNATKNGLEGMASCFNDLALIIDEIGEGDGREFGRIVYQLMSGTGKTRANRSGGISKRRVWRISLLSSGELPVSDFIENAKGGQLVRLIDIEASNLFIDRDDADAMKLGCAKHYGHAGIALLEGGNLADGWDSFDVELIGEAPTPEAGRVRDRFKLVAYVGELAISRGVLPWVAGSVLTCCKDVFAGWKLDSRAISDADRGIENVRNFLLAYGTSRFEVEREGREPIDRAGWFRNDLYHFTDRAFKEACDGVLESTVRKALRDDGLLHQSTDKKLKSQIRVETKLTYVTSIKADIFSSSDLGVATEATQATDQGAQHSSPSPITKVDRQHRQQESNGVAYVAYKETGEIGR